MSIIRRDKTNNYTTVSNECFQNPSISARAKGVYAYLMTLPDDWKVYKTELVKHFKEGRDAINKAFLELEDTGYITKQVTQKEGGLLNGWDFTVHESAVQLNDRLTENPFDGEPVTTKYLLLQNTNNTKSGVAGKSEDKNRTKGIKSKSSAHAKKKNVAPPEALAVARSIANSIKAQDRKNKSVLDENVEATCQRWALDIEKICSIDGRDYPSITRVMNWVAGDEFWKKNVLSGATLRKQFDKLAIKASEGKGGSSAGTLGHGGFNIR